MTQNLASSHLNHNEASAETSSLVLDTSSGNSKVGQLDTGADEADWRWKEISVMKGNLKGMNLGHGRN